MNINMFRDIWNNKVSNNGILNFIEISQPQLTEQYITKHYIFAMSDQVSKSSFLN